MIAFDARFPTSNTNLAACMGALRIPIKSVDPCSKVEEPDGRRIVTFYFEEAGDLHKAQDIKWAWDHREEFERTHPGHDLTFMREGLDRLSWLTKVYHGQISPADRVGVANYSTDDIGLAACFMQAGHKLHSFAKPLYHFALTENARETIIEEYECFRHGKSPTCQVRRAIECRALLLDLVKRAPKLLHYTVGDPMAGGKDGYIRADTNESALTKFFEILHD